MRRLVWIALALFSFEAIARAQTNSGIDELVRSAIEKQKTRPQWFQLRTVLLADIPYVYQYKARKAKFNGDGGIKNDASWREEIVLIEGVLFATPIESNIPVINDSNFKNQRELSNQKKLAELQSRPEAEKRKAEEVRKKRRDERSQFWAEFLKAFRFKLVEHKNHNGRPTSVVSLTPDPKYRPHGIVDTQYLPKLQGQLWIDDADQEIARIEIEFVKNVGAAFGIVGKVYKGTRYYMELAKQFEGQWLPARAKTELRMRTLFFKEHETFTVDFDNYRRFSSEVNIQAASVREPADTEREKLQGSWIVVGAETRGQQIAELKGGKFVFDGIAFTFQTALGNLKGEVSLGPSKSTRTADFIQQGSSRNHTWRAIYELAGSDLKVCYVEDGTEEDRPTNFATSPESRASLIVLKKE